MRVASSPSDCLIGTVSVYQVNAKRLFVSGHGSWAHMTKKTRIPTSEKLIRIPAGPARCSAFPEPTRRPGPMMPVSAEVSATWETGIECCRVFILRTSNGNHLKMP